VTMVLFRGVAKKAAPNWTPTAVESGPRPRDQRRPAVLVWIAEAWQRRRSRVYLPQLDDRMLRDIGIIRAEADREAGKPFWLP
jgi:uncharacterized protein YjiS (DUF1127 family)